MVGQLGGLDAVGGVDPVVVLVLLDALHRQERSLARAANQLIVESVRIPNLAPDDEGGWRGPARTAYESALGRLHSTVGQATDAVTGALRETRAAIGSLGSRIP